MIPQHLLTAHFVAEAPRVRDGLEESEPVNRNKPRAFPAISTGPLQAFKTPRPQRGGQEFDPPRSTYNTQFLITYKSFVCENLSLTWDQVMK